MKKKVIYFIAVFALAVLFSACSKDEFKAKDAQKALKEASNEIAGYVSEFKKSEGMSSVMNTSNLGKRTTGKQTENGGMLFKNIALNLVKPIAEKFHIETKKTTAEFDLALYAGTYSWNFATNAWVYAKGVPADKIVVTFPATETATTNNAVFTLHSISEQEITSEYNDVYLAITGISADFYVNNVKQLELNFGAKYSAKGDPTETNINLFFNPYTLAVKATMNNFDIYENFSLKKAGETLISSEATGVSSTVYDIPKSISGYFQAGSIQMNVDMNVEAIYAASENSAQFTNMVGLINDNTDAVLYSYPEHIKIGTLELEQSNEEIKVMVVYANDSREDMKPYFEQIGKLIEEIIADFEANFNIDNFPEI